MRIPVVSSQCYRDLANGSRNFDWSLMQLQSGKKLAFELSCLLNSLTILIFFYTFSWLGFSRYVIISDANYDKFTSPLSIFVLLILFSLWRYYHVMVIPMW